MISHKKYTFVKILLGCLFIGLQSAIFITAWLLFTEGITWGRLVVIIASFLLAYIGGACHGTINRKIEKSKEEQNK